MPKDFPPLKTVYDHFSKWNKRGIWEKCLDRLTACHRLKEGRTALPSYGIIDAQSVKTQYASEERGIDGGKKVKRHKRHIVVDILGNLLYVRVHAANLSDTKSACEVLEGAASKFPSLEAFSGDAGYRGTAVEFTSTKLGMTTMGSRANVFLARLFPPLIKEFRNTDCNCRKYDPYCDAKIKPCKMMLMFCQTASNYLIFILQVIRIHAG